MKIEDYENKALVITGKKRMSVESRLFCKAGPDDVLLKIAFCGICGTDLHLWALNGVGMWTLITPCVLGHEGSATVLKVGTNVKHLNIGARVTMEPGAYCGTCVHCTAGSNNLCHMNTVERLDLEGFFQNYITYTSYLCHRLPDCVSLSEGALVEPLACALRGVIRARVTAGEEVLILRSGTIGLLTAHACRSFGTHRIIMTDVNQIRLDLAASIGASDAGYLVMKEKDLVTQCQELTALMGGSQSDVTLDCTGLESCLRLAIDVTKRGGRVGLSAGQVTVPLTIASMKEIDLISSAKYDTADFQLALKMMENKVIDAAKIVSHVIQLSDFQEAFELLEKGTGVKVLIQC